MGQRRRYVVQNSHAVAGEYGDDDELGEIDPIVPGDGEQEMTLDFHDDFINREQFKKDKHFKDLNDVGVRPVDVDDIGE